MKNIELLLIFMLGICFFNTAVAQKVGNNDLMTKLILKTGPPH
jgi:hypothetical protein